jgi:dTMP kinase
VPVDVAFKRIDGRSENNRYEQMGLDFHQKVRDGFLFLADKNSRIKIIDGTKNQQEISVEIIDELIQKTALLLTSK